MNSYPEIGEVLGKYKLISELGKGTTATVYKASHKYLNVDVALKVLSPQLISENESIRDRFIEEAMNHAQLVHNNLVRIIDVEKEEKFTYIVMEFVDGDTLDKILKEKGTIPPLKAIKIILEVCKALNHAFSQHMIHRDIKPGNIIITKDSQVKLTDFGLAKRVHEPDKYDSNTGEIFGTPYYMPPEQFIDSQSVDHRSDLYSLGATFYHLVTGKIPFETNSLKEIFNMHVNSTPIPPYHVNQEVTHELSDVIMKLLEKSLNERYQDYNSLTRDLERIEYNYKLNDTIPTEDIPEPNSDSSEPNRIQKLQMYQKYYRPFNEKDESESVKEEAENTGLELIGLDNPPVIVSSATFSKVKELDIDISKNVAKYIDSTNPSEEFGGEISERLSQKYKKYFKQFNDGEEIEKVFSKIEDDKVTAKQKQVAPVVPKQQDMPKLITKLHVTSELSEDLNEEFDKFNQSKKLKVNASKYIQKFKQILETKII